jgi:hypothetical protein
MKEFKLPINVLSWSRLPEATEQEEDLLDQGNLCSSYVNSKPVLWIWIQLDVDPDLIGSG